MSELDRALDSTMDRDEQKFYAEQKRCNLTFTRHHRPNPYGVRTFLASTVVEGHKVNVEVRVRDKRTKPDSSTIPGFSMFRAKTVHNGCVWSVQRFYPDGTHDTATEEAERAVFEMGQIFNNSQEVASLVNQVKRAEERIEQLTEAIEKLPTYVDNLQEAVSHVERCRLSAGVLKGAKMREHKLIELVKEGVRLASHEEDGHAVNHNRHSDECEAFIAKAKELLG